MRTKTTYWKRGLALLLAVMLCICFLPGTAMTVEAAKSKTVSAKIKFYNHTGKRITELYFEDSNADDYGEEYLSSRNFRYWSNNRYIMVPLKFKKSASLDFLICYSDGSVYEAQGLKLSKAKSSGCVIDLTKSKVTLKVKNKKVASAAFVKVEDEDEDETPSVTGVSLSQTTATIASGQTINLTATVSPSGANRKVIWSSSDKTIAKVTSTGKVTGVKAGTATITAKTVDGGYIAACYVKVTPKKVTGVILNKTSLSLKVGGTACLSATVSPSGANRNVSWSSSDPSVATVSSSGKVTGVKPGTATITVKTMDGGYTASCTVTVAAKTISTTVDFYNRTGKQIKELYFVENGDSSWGEEYLATRSLKEWNTGKYIQVPLKFTTDASLDFYIRCSDGSAYEARGLSLAKAKNSGNKIEMTASEVRLIVSGTVAATVAFVQKEAPTATDPAISDADWAVLQSNYDALVKAYNAAASLYNSDQIKADKDIEALMTEAKKLIEQMGTIERKTLTAADGKTLNEAMKQTAEALGKIVEAMEVATRTINVKFINGTTADFTNFTAKPQGGTGSEPVTLKAGLGETTLQFTVADNVSAFEITFVESVNSQPYTMTVTFDSSVKDGDTLTVQFNVNEATQEIVYSQI